MKAKVLALPSLAIVGKLIPARRRKSVLGSLFALRLLPGWALGVALIGFVVALRSRRRPSVSDTLAYDLDG